MIDSKIDAQAVRFLSVMSLFDIGGKIHVFL